MNELTMSRTDKYTHTIVKYHSIDGMWLNIEHIEQTVLRSKYKMTKTLEIRIGPCGHAFNVYNVTLST